MTTPIISHHIDHPNAWKSTDFKSQDDFSIDLEPHHVDALEQALGQARKAGLSIDEITKDNFPLDDIQDLLDQVSHELMDGRGFLMLRGWPIDQYSLDDIGVMYYGFGVHFGKGASQSVLGDRLGYVTDHSASDPLERAYRNKYELSLHTDLNELIGMLNIRPATGSTMSNWDLGGVRVDRVLENEAPLLAPDILFPDFDPEVLDAHRDWLESNLLQPGTNLLILAFNSYVIRTKHHVILVDTCTGNDKERPHKPRYHMKNWPFLERLAAVGLSPADIDFVMCTHLHVDHVGWNTRLINGRWVPTFPNARYLFIKDEFDHWQNDEKRALYTTDPYFEDSLLPVIEAGQADFVDMDYAFDDAAWLDPTPGHTPGHVCVHVKGTHSEAVMSGDLMHHAFQCTMPAWNSCFCVDPTASREMRRAFLDRHADSDTLIKPAHFPTPSVGRIRRDGDAFRFAFVEEAVTA